MPAQPPTLNAQQGVLLNLKRTIVIQFSVQYSRQYNRVDVLM